jgi:hypothetical protein
MWARFVNAALSTWLIASSVLLRHDRFQAANGVVCGVLALVVAVTGILLRKPTRILNVVIGAWLLVSAVFLPHASPLSAWNQGVVGYLLIGFAFVPLRSSPDVGPTAPVNW